MLILRDVLDFSAVEVASTLDTSTAAVNSALQRARATLATLTIPLREDPSDVDARATVDRYVAAFEAADVPALVGLLAHDAILEMPPMLNWYVGRDHYGRFIARVFASRGPGWRMLLIAANGQPGVAAYAPDEGGHLLHTVQVFDIDGAGIRRNTTFQDGDVFALFDLAPRLP